MTFYDDEGIASPLLNDADLRECYVCARSQGNTVVKLIVKELGPELE
eukprot:CAMPEP_0201281016 /NCGR_PEP_ID=MMETSP1317-20130820/869_1 /ASSEMBLY_ACC=CAM_ASM_000770 /TAXON_ID=187299 /ORGANISM="Undescribed Undescribed, Strain Undescribed" /LENGTH=46 /DNA_ID= /DNA_START= /DNA_END= /DNA_ORIENTATION=